MFTNSLKVALRFLWRNKTYTILNFLCLTFGLACSITAVLHISRVLSFDKFHKNYERLYAIEAFVTYFNGDQFPKEVLSSSLVEIISENAPEIEQLTRVANRSYTFIYGDKEFTENGIYADGNFLDMFSFPLVSGAISGDMEQGNTILISERMADKFFGSPDCIGKALIMKGNTGTEAYKIEGVLRDVPARSSIQFDFLIPFSKFLADNNWANETGASANMIWGLLNKNSQADSVNQKIRDLIKTQETTLNQELFLFPLKEKVLYYYSGGRRIWREMQYLVIAGVLGFAILMIACFNYINLAIAMNIRRYREAGIRKVMGAKKSTIIYQYLTETFILTLVSFFVAIDLVRVLVKVYNTRFNGDLHFSNSDVNIVLVFAAIAVLTGIISGLLPALYLSSSSPVTTLKGKIVTSHSYSLFRQSLIVFQFTIPIVFIICMMIIKVQDKYIRDFDLGFNKDKLLIIRNTGNIEDHEESFKNEVLSIPGIESVSFSNCVPTRGATVTNEVNWDGKDPLEKLHFWHINADFNYKDVVNINMTAGRYFDKSFPSDSACFVINNIAADVMKYKDPVGRSLTLDGKKGTIIGVFQDFHALDLSGPFTPTIISVTSANRENILISYSTGSYSVVSESISKVYKKYESDLMFQSRLFSDLQKRSELTTSSNIIGAAFVLALLLACLGLSGLASFTAESRTKEIGLRKLNGATIFSVINLLGRNYTKWIVISTMFSLPVAFLLGNIFLARFNFRAPMPLWPYIAGPFIACIIALASVSGQSWRAASKNPVESIRYE